MGNAQSEETSAEEPLLNEENKESGDDANTEEKKEMTVDDLPDVVGKSDSCFHCPDFIFMLAWIASVAIVIGLAFGIGAPAIEDIDDQVIDKMTGALSDNFDEDALKVLYIPLYAIGMAAACSIVWVIVLLLCGRLLMYLFLLALIGGSGFGAFYFYNTDTKIAMAFAIIFMFISMYTCMIRGALDFAAKSLQIACHVVLCYNTLIIMALAVVVLTAAYLVVWLVSCIGLYIYLKYENDDDEINNNVTYQLLTFFTLMLCFFWTAEVLKNIVVTATCSVTATWWFGKSACTATLVGFCRAITVNLGAICFGSLLVAIVNALLATCKAAEKALGENANWAVKLILKVVQCVLACIKCCIEYMTSYAYAFVGIYGYSFIWAGIQVFKLLGSDLPFIATNDGLVGTVILVGQILSSFFCAYGAYYLCETKDWDDAFPDNEMQIASGCFWIGYALTGVVFALIIASNRATLILWKEQPYALKVAHKGFYDDLYDVWVNTLGRDMPSEGKPEEGADEEAGKEKKDEKPAAEKEEPAAEEAGDDAKTDE